MRKRDLLILLAALTTAAVTAVGIFSGSALPTGAWGLSFRQEGAPPIGNAGIDQLKRYDAAYIGNTSEKVLYLTFDAGYENGCTEKILDTLEKHNVKAAFFLVGNYIEKNADLVRRMTEEGHTVGNHTMHHYDMSRISEKAAFAKELQDLEALYRDTTGRDMPKYYRPPQGIYRICAWRRSWATGRFSGALPTWTGTTIPNPPGSRPSPSCCRGPTPAQWCCCTLRPKPTRKSSMSC